MTAVAEVVEVVDCETKGQMFLSVVAGSQSYSRKASVQLMLKQAY